MSGNNILTTIIEYINSPSDSRLGAAGIFAIVALTILTLRFSSIYISNILNKRKINFFYSVEDEKIDTRHSAHELSIRLLQKQIENLTKKVDAISSKNIEELTKIQMTQYIENNIERTASYALKNSQIIEKNIKERFDFHLLENLNKYLESIPQEDIAAMRAEYAIAERQEQAHQKLELIMDKERNSASLLKQVMINLFIIVNFSLLATYFLFAGSITQNMALAITGLYISLAAFIIYIFRSSNSRTSTLLAILEDIKNQLLVKDFVTSKKRSELTGNDIEFIRLILTNHAEREKQTKHPYEVILKGVSGSNIQLGNGKFSASKENQK